MLILDLAIVFTQFHICLRICMVFCVIDMACFDFLDRV